MDLKIMREKLNRLKNAGKASEHLWKPEEGKQIIRIVPLASNPDNPFTEMYFHYGMNGKTYLSPRTFGKPDPIADFADKLKGDGSKESYEQAKPFLPKMRTYVPIVVRGKESDGVKFWAFGKTVCEQILSIIDDEDYGDITDPQTGRDIVVEFTPKDKSDTNFAKTSIRPKPSQTKITSDAELLNKVLTQQPDLSTMFREYTPAELQSILETYLSMGDTSSDTQDETPTPEKFTSPSAEKAVGSESAVSTVEEQFDKLFNDE